MPPRRIIQVPAGQQPITVAGRQPWNTLSSSQRRSLYQIGEQAGQSKSRVRQLYAQNKPIGSSRWFHQRARVIISGELKPGVNTPYSKLKGTGKTRVDNAIARRQQRNPSLTRRRALYEYEQGIWRPFARNPKDRITPEDRAANDKKVPVISTQGPFFPWQMDMDPMYADRAWAHYFAVDSYLDVSNSRLNRHGVAYTNSAARKLEQWGQEPLESRMIRTYDGRAWELETNLDQLDQMAVQYNLSRYAISQETGSGGLAEEAPMPEVA